MRVPRTENNEGLELPDFPTHVCICGSQFWNVQVLFKDYEIAFYNLDMECVNCGARATAPTPVDKPGYVRNDDND